MAVNHQKSNQHIAKQPTTQNKQRNAKIKAHHISLYVVLFMAIWIFSSFIYGDVFYIAEQNIYFAFDKTAMEGILSMNDWWFILLGRMLLLPFHYPLMGGLLLSILLTMVAWLLDYVCYTRGLYRLIPLAIPILYLMYVIGIGLNLFHLHEPAFLMAVPFLAFVVMGIVAIVVRMVTKRHFTNIYVIGQSDSIRSNHIQTIVLLSLIIVLWIWAVPMHRNERTLALMTRQMQDEDWQGMVDAGKNVDCLCRQACCYYAIALSQLNQLDDHLFEIHFQYPNMHIKDRSGNADYSSEYYNADGNFFAGLISTSFHNCMDRCVMDGPSAIVLQRMYFCALLLKEKMLAHKFLDLLSRMPFEQWFVEKYRPLLHNEKLIKQNPMLSQVMDVMPVQDSFEQWYPSPLFIGYNISLTSGRSMKALNHSLIACLYAKELNAFYQRALSMRGLKLSPIMESAITTMGLRQPQLLKPFSVSPYTQGHAQQFISDASSRRTNDQKETYYKLEEDYKGFYPLYYYYENVPDENYVPEKKTQGQVN